MKEEKFFYKPITEEERIDLIKISLWREIYNYTPMVFSTDHRMFLYAKELRKNNIGVPPRVRLAEMEYEQNNI